MSNRTGSYPNRNGFSSDHWERQNSRRFYRRWYRNAPTKLVPAVISCHISSSLMVFGIFLLIIGSVLRFVVGAQTPSDRHKVESNVETFMIKPEDINTMGPEQEFYSSTRFAGTIMLIIGSILTVCSIIGIIISFVFYHNYQNERRIGLESTASPHAFTNPQVYDLSPNSAVGYPAQTGYQYGPGYQAVAQNVVYNPTTEPNAAISLT